MNFQYETAKTRERELKAYKEAFDYYDWNKSGTISIKVGLEYDKMKFPIKIMYYSFHICLYFCFSATIVLMVYP